MLWPQTFGCSRIQTSCCSVRGKRRRGIFPTGIPEEKSSYILVLTTSVLSSANWTFALEVRILLLSIYLIMRAPSYYAVHSIQGDYDEFVG